MDQLLGTVLAQLPKKKGRSSSGVRYWAASCPFLLEAELYFLKHAEAKLPLCH